MNGRMYDPKLGRFLSPDNYVQLPDNPQNLNRYSYCLNNPLKYADPDGQWFIPSVISGFVKGFKNFVTGNGNVFSPLTEAFRNGFNDLKVTWGLFKGTPKQILSRFTKELPQTIIGLNYSYARLVYEEIDKVEYFDGATYVINVKNTKGNGVTLGSYININSNSVPYDNGHFAPYNSYLYAHEYGHYLQSQDVGWNYLTKYGIPSIINAASNNGKKEYCWNENIKSYVKVSSHQAYWTEIDANTRAQEYFRKVLGNLWTFQDKYPVR